MVDKPSPFLQSATPEAPHRLFKNTTAFQRLHLQTAGIWNMSKPVCDASPQCLKPKENWTSSFMLCHEDTCCFDFQRLLFFHFISNLVMWNFHVLWPQISFKGIGYSCLSSPLQNSYSHTLKNLYYLQCLWIRVFLTWTQTQKQSYLYLLYIFKKILYLFWKVFGASKWRGSLEETDWNQSE